MSKRLTLIAPLAAALAVSGCDQPLAPELSGFAIEPSVAAHVGTDLSGEFDFPNPPLVFDFEIKPNGFFWVKRLISEVRFSGDIVAEGILDQRGAWNEEGNGWIGATFSLNVTKLQDEPVSGTLIGPANAAVRKFFVPSGREARLRGGGDLAGYTFVFTATGPLGGPFAWNGRLIETEKH